MAWASRYRWGRCPPLIDVALLYGNVADRATADAGHSGSRRASLGEELENRPGIVHNDRHRTALRIGNTKVQVDAQSMENSRREPLRRHRVIHRMGAVL